MMELKLCCFEDSVYEMAINFSMLGFLLKDVLINDIDDTSIIFQVIWLLIWGHVIKNQCK